jgi:RNA polymerase-binding transcription factor DksA
MRSATHVALEMLLSRRHALADLGLVPLAALAELDEALLRIEQERFGECERCGSAIGRGRLLALPETRFCATCSQAHAGGSR